MGSGWITDQGNYSVVVIGSGAPVVSSNAVLTVDSGLPVVTIRNDLTNFTFKGDTTYYIPHTVSLWGNTTVEGRSVIKFSTNEDAMIAFYGIVNCQTVSYRPTVFTARDDDTVGLPIPGSTGTPDGQYGTLDNEFDGNTFSDLRISYLKCGISSSGYGFTCDNLQVINCKTAFQNNAGNITLNNALIYGSDSVFAEEPAEIWCNNATFHNCNTFVHDPSTAVVAPSFYLTNCLLVAVTNLGEHYADPAITNYFQSCPTGLRVKG